jgi:Exo-beta-D-glucosaminidase Ig-fold domain/Glycosyl hydrolases family 2
MVIVKALVALVAGMLVCAALAPQVPGAHAADAEPGTSELLSGWQIRSSARVGSPGSVISDPGYAATGWLPISRPETLMAGLVENGRYPDVFYSRRLAAVPTRQFAVPWWYRDALELHPLPGQHTFLRINGLLSRGDLWVNGAKVADRSLLQGAYSQVELDITRLVRDGANAIALRVYPNDAGDAGYLTLGMVDWNPPSPDGFTGLQFAPEIAQDGAISLRAAHVVEHNARDLSTSALTVKAELRNNTAVAQQARLVGTISHGDTDIAFDRSVQVPANATVRLVLAPARIPQLRIRHPALWWPYQMGAQPLYHLALEAQVADVASDSFSEDFGIRTVTSGLTPVVPGTYGASGYRQFSINGRPFVVRGGGWSQDMFLSYAPGNVGDQLAYVKNLGLNAIRFEGNLPPDDMFQQLDRAGILALPGWQCCARWEQPSDEWSAALRANARNQAAHVAAMLRDHPSVIAFYQGSDDPPDATKEALYLAAFRRADWQVPQIASAEYKSSRRLGPSGSKEGPYNWAPPAYWWDSGREMDVGGSFTNAGGAFGFDTEASAGITMPTRDSLDRFLTPRDERQLWDVRSVAGTGSGPDIFHSSPYHGYTAIGRLGQYNTALWNRYGHWSGLASYEREAQAAGYEVARAQFEAYIGQAHDRANPSTGLIYWQLDKAWPSVQWQLYGYDLDQAGVYFGAKKANEPVHILYAYSDRSIRVSNLTNAPQAGLRAHVAFRPIDGGRPVVRTVAVPRVRGQGVRTVMRPGVPPGMSSTYFLELTLTRRGTVVSRNVYWLSTRPDRIDWAATLGNGSGAVALPGGYADLGGLQRLARAPVRVRAATTREGANDVTVVRIRNVGRLAIPAFLLRADVRRGSRGGEVLPIRWSDNDQTIWPGEQLTLTARYRAGDLRGRPPVVAVAGWNVPRRVVAAPVNPRA